MIKSVLKLFGTQNDKIVKNYLKKVNGINALEAQYESLEDDALKLAFEALKTSVQDGSKTLDDVLNDSFAITREVAKRTLHMRHYDVQMVGGMVLNDGNIAEMKTGEGKTLVATLAVVLNAMEGKGVHIVTVNDYLASRDSVEMSPVYEFLGYTVGCLTADIHDDMGRKAQYDADITYGTNNEYGFDYLRDNMKVRAEEKAQGLHHYAIIDEVDSILIDEARTPLIISGPTQRDHNHYARADAIAQKMVRGEKLDTKAGEPEQTTGDFIVDEKNRTVIMTEDGLQKAQDLFEVENLYNLENAALSHHLDQALKAHYIFENDVDYVVQNNEIIIVDEFTGRLSEGRRYSEGLHQALEAKEAVEIQEESQTLAEITYQNYFRLYEKLAGMTGTAQTEATEFSQIYGLDVISIPTNVPIGRLDKNDLIYNTEREKLDAVVKRVRELHAKGQPVLIGTASIEKSEMIDQRLKNEKIPHNMLNAKNHSHEAEIIMNAGQKAAVTVATNMAGRGVDIKIDDEVKSLGGLMILGTERHESRRIDNQLRGRSGRQGDAGESQFFLSLDDNLLRIFGGDKIRNIMNKLGVEDGEYIDSKIVTRSVEKAQKKVENQHYESRKHILEYDDVANHQRKAIYAFRNQLLDPEFDIDGKIKENRAEYIAHLLGEAEIFEGMPTEDFDLEKLAAIIKEEIHIEVKSEQFEGKEVEEMTTMIRDMMENLYESKMSEIDEGQRQEIERILYLQVLDPQWRDHLYEMDVLKTGIGLRGYNQKDPLTEYKQDSYKLFTDLVGRIKLEAVKVLQLVQFNFESPEEEEAAVEQIREELESSVSDASFNQSYEEGVIAEDSGLKPILSTKKPKRNEPCPCGSGKKYKNCCGQSGPKKRPIGLTMQHKRLTSPNKKFVRHIIKHYLKYDKENPFIFISGMLAFLGIAAGVMVLMIAMGIMNGTQKEFSKKLFVMNYPLTILPIQEDSVNDALIASLSKQFPQLQFSPYYTTQVITKNDGAVQGSLLYGVDYHKEGEINEIFKNAKGNEKSKFRVVMGEGLSFEMNVLKKDKVTLYFSEQQAIGFGTMPLQKRFVIDGVFKSGLKAYDKAIMYTSLEAFEKLLKRKHGSYDGLHIYTENPMDEIEKIRAVLPEMTVIEGWWQQNGNFFAAMEMEKKALFLVLLLIILVASLNIISSLLMTVMSRRSEIALMRTLGASRKEIRSIFFRLGIIIGSAGIVAGTLLGSLGIWVLTTFDIISMPADVYGTSKLPVDLSMSDFGFILLGTSIIILLSSLYPAKKAAQTDPLTVLRNE